MVYNIYKDSGIIHDDETILEFICEYDPYLTSVDNVSWTNYIISDNLNELFVLRKNIIAIITGRILCDIPLFYF